VNLDFCQKKMRDRKLKFGNLVFCQKNARRKIKVWKKIFQEKVRDGKLKFENYFSETDN
jgi:hypothetical protein